jgi:hypothetical protein
MLRLIPLRERLLLLLPVLVNHTQCFIHPRLTLDAPLVSREVPRERTGSRGEPVLQEGLRVDVGGSDGLASDVDREKPFEVKVLTSLKLDLGRAGAGVPGIVATNYSPCGVKAFPLCIEEAKTAELLWEERRELRRVIESATYLIEADSFRFLPAGKRGGSVELSCKRDKTRTNWTC